MAKVESFYTIIVRLKLSPQHRGSLSAGSCHTYETTGSDMSVSLPPPSSSDGRNEVRFFWDGGLLANTPLRQTILAHRYYWQRVRKVEDDIPRLRFCIINLHPLKQEYLPSDYDGVVDRKNDIIYHDRTEFDENVAVLMSDFMTLAQSLLKLAEESGASKKALQKILNERTKGVFFVTRKQGRYEDLLKGKIDVDFVARLERKNDSHTISNKIFDFTKCAASIHG